MPTCETVFRRPVRRGVRGQLMTQFARCVAASVPVAFLLSSAQVACAAVGDPTIPARVIDQAYWTAWEGGLAGPTQQINGIGPLPTRRMRRWPRTALQQTTVTGSIHALRTHVAQLRPARSAPSAVISERRRTRSPSIRQRLRSRLRPSRRSTSDTPAISTRPIRISRAPCAGARRVWSPTLPEPSACRVRTTSKRLSRDVVTVRPAIPRFR